MRDKAISKAIDAALFGKELHKLSTHFGQYHVIGWRNFGDEPNILQGVTRGYICEWEMNPPEVLQEHQALTLKEALELINKVWMKESFTTETAL